MTESWEGQAKPVAGKVTGLTWKKHSVFETGFPVSSLALDFQCSQG